MFTITQYVYLIVIGVGSFFLALIIGGAINVSTGVPLAGGIANGIIVGILLTIGVKGVGRFGAATIIWLIFAVLAVPSGTLGPPHISKIIVGLGAGIIWDFTISLFQRRNIGYAIGGGIGSAFIVVGVYLFVLFFDLEQATAIKRWLPGLTIMNLVIGFISTYIGATIFDKNLLDTPMANKISGKNTVG